MNISGVAPIKGVDGENAVRRTGIVDLDNCNTCHERIGFHSNAGRMANVEYCQTCHNPELSSSNIFEGFATFPLAGNEEFFYKQTSNNFKDMIHSIHAAPFREEQNPEDPYNFIRVESACWRWLGPDGVPGRPVSAPGQRLRGLPQVRHAVPARRRGRGRSRLVGLRRSSRALGTATTFNPLLTIRKGPATAACANCHSSPEAAAHIQANTSATARAESCVVCHGEGRAYEAHGE